ncbi:MAG: monovalent cation/H+ antiporter complex subunit F [Pseudolabrys sp.]|jgi:multicomponent Na+:H+ antiporter subunit F
MAMANFLLGAAGFVLAMVALGLLSVFRGPSDADRMLSAQLIGTGGVSVLLLLAVATEIPSIADVALMLALLAPFAAVAFLRDASSAQIKSPNATDRA